MLTIFRASIYHSCLYTFNELILNRLYSAAASVLLILLPILPTGAVNWNQCMIDIHLQTPVGSSLLAKMRDDRLEPNTTNTTY